MLEGIKYSPPGELTIGGPYTGSFMDGTLSFANPACQVLYTWKPKPDITAYELALCLPALSGKILPLQIASLPPEALRHFEKKGS